MITDSFDNDTLPIIDPKRDDNAPKVDICIITFSYKIEEYVIKNYPIRKIATLENVAYRTPIYEINHNNKKIAFYKTGIGAPITIGTLEDFLTCIECNKFIVFGGAGCLDKEIERGEIIIPSFAYRDEGTSYHYAMASDYIEIKNKRIVQNFFDNIKLKYKVGKTWTTDGFFRETRRNFNKRKEEGCISVEMECASLQAMFDFKKLDFYTFLIGADLLDAPKWDEREKRGEKEGSQEDEEYFKLALRLSDYILNL